MTQTADPFTKVRFHLRASALVIAAVIVVCGCGGGSTSSPTPFSPPGTPVPQNARVTGQYNLVLTSTNGTRNDKYLYRLYASRNDIYGSCKYARLPIECFVAMQR
jgi:hypothetical protein